MPRKYQKRKNNNCQNGRRKPKPIKFNPSELESEQKFLQESIENDVLGFEEETQDVEDELKFIDSDNNNKSGNDNDADGDDTDGAGQSQILLITTPDDNENDHNNQNDKKEVEKIDDEIEPNSTSSNKSSSIKESIGVLFDKSISHLENEKNTSESDHSSQIIPITETPESTNDHVIDSDINRKSYGNTDASFDIIHFTKTDAHIMDKCVSAKNMMLSLDNTYENDINHSSVKPEDQTTSINENRFDISTTGMKADNAQCTEQDQQIQYYTEKLNGPITETRNTCEENFSSEQPQIDEIKVVYGNSMNVSITQIEKVNPMENEFETNPETCGPNSKQTDCIESSEPSDLNKAMSIKNDLSLDDCTIQELDETKSSIDNDKISLIAEVVPQQESFLSNASFLQPINNSLRAIGDENSDIEQKKPEEVGIERVNHSSNVDSVHLKSILDFSRVTQHINLLDPSAETIREEQSCIDTKLIEPISVTENAQPCIKSLVHAESVHLDSSLSNTDLNDIESQDLNSKLDVCFETPAIGSNSFSAFKTINKNISSDHSFNSMQMLNNTSKLHERNSPNENTNVMLPILSNNSDSGCKVPSTSSIDHHSFKPINESSLQTLLEEIVAASSESLNENDDENEKSDVSSNKCENIEINFNDDKHIHKQQNMIKHDEFISSSEMGSNTIFVAKNQHLDDNFSSTANVYKTELDRMDLSHTGSKLRSHCEEKQLFTSQSSPSDLRECIEVTNVKPLLQLSVECLTSLPYGDLILDELTRASSQLIDRNIDYTQLKLAHSDNLEIHSKLLQQPKVPPRYQSKIKFNSDYKLKSSLSPPPVPPRPCTYSPKHENPKYFGCQSEFDRPEHPEPNQQFDLHNENTDDEVKQINSRDSVTLSKIQTTECKISNMKTKDNNKLLALIREINQLTNTSAGKHSNDHVNEKKETVLSTKRSLQSPAEQQSDQVSFEMSHSSADQNYFNNKRFFIYFDQLCRLHPIVEETPKVYTNETTNYQSRKRIENNQIVYEHSDSSHERISNMKENCTNEKSSTKNHMLNAALNECPFDVNTDKAFREIPSANETKNPYCNYLESKNSSIRMDESVHLDDSINKSSKDETLEKNTTETQKNIESSSFFKEIDFVPKIFSNFFRANNTKTQCASDDVITQDSSETTVHTNSEIKNFTTNRCEIGDNGQNSMSPLPLKRSERHSSTQDLYSSFSEECGAPMSGSPLTSALGVRGVTNIGRISTNPIRAPRINDTVEINSNKTLTTALDSQHRHYDWKPANQRRNFENRQSMIDQTPISRHVIQNRRLSLPKAMADKQLSYILEQEKQISNEFDQLERDRLRLLKELEEMQINQSFESIFKEHKKQNSILPSLEPLSEEDLIKKRMQEEWLSKVAEREERRLQKIIKFTHNISETAPSHINRGLADEFLDRVEERRTKLQMSSDSDLESGAESMPIQLDQPFLKTDSSVKVIDLDHCEADFKSLPKHLQEFIEFTTKSVSNDIKSECNANATDIVKSEPNEILHKIEQSDNLDGIWSPSGTPQPSRRKIGPTLNQFKSEPSLYQPSTSATEHREFRSVRFATPTETITNLTKQQNTCSTQSLTQPTINVVPPTPPTKKFEENSSEHGADHSKVRSYYPAGVRQINDASHSHNMKHQQNSEHERQSKMAYHGRFNEPLEVTSRSEANDSQHDWYKKIYNTIHKVSDGDGYVTVRYKTRRGQYPYKSSNGYASEPEHNYNSDYSIKYKTMDRRRNTPSSNMYNTLPNPIKSANFTYDNKPGKIEDFTPDYTFTTDKKCREDQFRMRHGINKACEGNLSRALKDQGYESDSTLVFRRKENSQIAPLSPVEQKQAYLNLQAGGEAPLQGFRKPAPEKPKECETVPPLPPPPSVVGAYYNTEQPNLDSSRRYIEDNVNIHYKAPIRFEIKTPISDAELIHRQEQAKKIYQEERRRKYLQELQDLNNRRHTDNFTPSQKSPISLNRYDDFDSLYDYTVKSSNFPRTVARALYNFQGQTSRELSFKKGDFIFIRRKIDENWYEGEFNATIGLLPSNYVEIISKDDVRLPTKKPAEGQARAKFNFQAQSAIELSLHKGELIILTRRVDDNWFEGRVANRKGIFPVSYVEVLTDIGSDSLSAVVSKPVGAPAAHSLITSPNYQLSPRSNYSTDVTTNTNVISNGSHSPVVRETSKTLQKTEVLHVDTDSEPVPYRAIYKYIPQNSDELDLQEGDTVYVLEKCDDNWYVGTSQRTGFFGTFPGNYVERI